MQFRFVSLLAVGVALTFSFSSTADAGPGKKAQARKARKAAKRKARLAEMERRAKLVQIEHWIAVLQRPDPLDRFYAGWNLIVLQPASTDELLKRLEKPLKPEVTVAFCEVLSESSSDPNRTLAAFEKLLGSKHEEVRVAALTAAARLLTPGSRALLEKTAAGSDPLLRRIAVIALGMCEYPTAGAAASKALKEDDTALRLAGLRTIGYIKDRRYIPQCVEALTDQRRMVAGQAANTLGKIGDVAIADRISDLLRGVKPGAFRFYVVEGLSRLGKQVAIEELLATLRNPNSPLQADAATVLYEINEPKATPHFRKILGESFKGKHRPGADLIIAHAMGVLKREEAIPELIQSLVKGRVEVRRAAAWSLGILKAQDAVEPLLKTVTAGDRRVRAAALLALARINKDKSWAPLTKALRDREPSVRYTALVALTQLKERRALPKINPLLKDAHPFVADMAVQAIAALEGRPRRGLDQRNGIYVSRLWALEREFFLRLEAPRAASAALEEGRMITETVVTTESYFSTCGGTHPPVEYTIETIKEVEIGFREGRAAVDYMPQFEEAYRLRTLRSEARDLVGGRDTDEGN